MSLLFKPPQQQLVAQLRAVSGSSGSHRVVRSCSKTKRESVKPGAQSEWIILLLVCLTLLLPYDLISSTSLSPSLSHTHTLTHSAFPRFGFSTRTGSLYVVTMELKISAAGSDLITRKERNKERGRGLFVHDEMSRHLLTVQHCTWVTIKLLNHSII